MSSHLLYLTGRPCSGKSTLAAALTSPWRSTATAKPFLHTVYLSRPPVTELGGRRETFSGTDALSMSVSPKVIEWMAFQRDGALVLGEGDRLATGKFFDAADGAGFTVFHAHIDIPDDVAQARMDERGWEPSPSWLAGRVTKSANLAHRATLVLDGTHPVKDLAAELIAASPVAHALRERAI